MLRVAAVAVLFEIMIFDVPVYLRPVAVLLFQMVPVPLIVMLPVPNAIVRVLPLLVEKEVQVRE